jgi:hypothetical protein
MSRRPAFLVTLEALPGIDATRALRAALKRLLRDFGLRCVEVRPTIPPKPAPKRKSP